jgi:hypothetical protein
MAFKLCTSIVVLFLTLNKRQELTPEHLLKNVDL